MKYLIQTARPRQWVKSAFLLTPALFTLQVLNPDVWLRLFYGMFGFSLIASAVYTLNDILNREEDRHHPLKRHRPIAAGRLSIQGASIWAVCLLLFGTGLMLQAGQHATLFGLVYFALMMLYSMLLRKYYLVDVLVIAVGFVLRVEAGAGIIEEPVSHWLLLCTFTIALYMAMIKRRQEIATLSKQEISTRQALRSYPCLSIIDGWIAALGGMTVLCYALYTVDPATVAKHQTGALLYTVPFVVYGIFRYRTLTDIGGAGEDPAGLVLNDTGIRLVVVLWALTVGAILFFAGN